MATKVADAERIQQEMQHVRSELRTEVQEIVAGAREMTDWRHYVATYPWLCIGAAAAVGYFLVPSRPVVIKPSTKDLLDLAKAHKLFVDPNPKPVQKQGILGSLTGMAMSAVLQTAMAVGSHQLDQFFKGLSERPRQPQPEEGANSP
jgi:hypothetical protein